jgi:hypothetical protein
MHIDNNKVVILTAFFLLFSLLHYGTYNLFFEETVEFVIKHIFQGILLLVYIALLISTLLKKTIFSLMFSTTILCIMLFVFSQSNANRTPILAVSLLFLFSCLYTQKYISLKIRSFLLFSAFIFILIADIQKQYGLSLDEIFYYYFSNSFSTTDFLKGSNYLGTYQDVSEYFAAMGQAVNSKLDLRFTMATQIIGVFLPRIFFPEKEVADISAIAFGYGITPQDLYYEIYLQSYLDSGVLGVFFYHLLLLQFGSYSYKMIFKFNGNLMNLFSVALYLTNLLIIIVLIRGPVVFLLWYGLVPNLIIFCLFLFKKKNQHRKIARD